MQLTTSFQKVAEKKLGNNGYGDVYIRLYAKYNSQSIANNTSNVTLEARIRTYGGYWWSDTGTSYRITGSGSIDTKAISKNGKYEVGETVLGSVTKDIGHDSSGNLTMTGSANFTSEPWGWNQTATASDMTLPTIPRYGTSNQSLNSKTETSITINWSSDSTVDYIWYSTDNGSTWTGKNVSDGKSGSYTISGLSAKTTYKIKTRIRRKDSQLTTDSTALSVTTYNYPFCNSMPDFTLGNSVILEFYNPLNRTFSMTVIGDDNSEILTVDVSGTSRNSLGSSSSVNKLYATIPNKKSGTYKVKVVYGSSEITKTGGTYSINANDCKPIFSDFDYSTNLSELTGNNSTIINGKTTTSVIISTSKKAQGYQGARITKYRIECGNNRAEVNYSENEIVQQFGSCTSPTLKITAIDSRGVEKTVSKTVTNFKNYVNPSFGVSSTERKNGVDTEAYLSASFNFWNGNFGAGDNKITSFAYRTKKRSESNYSNWYHIDLENIEIVNDEGNLYDYMIHANGSSGGFEIGIAYDIQLSVSDGLDTYTLTTATSTAITLTDGKVGLSLLKDENGDYHVGIDCMPDLKAPIAVKNKIPLVKVSGEEPDTGEEVWMQKGKNLFNGVISKGNVLGESLTVRLYTRQEIFIKKGTTVTFSTNLDLSVYSYYVGILENAPNYYIGQSTQPNYIYDSSWQTSESTITFTAPQDGYIAVGFKKADGSELTPDDVSIYNYQLEQGTTATSYEPYIEKKIYTKNDNGDYEKFYNESRIGEIRITSTNENPSNYLSGIWELVGKDFINIYGKNDASFTPSDMVTAYTIHFERNNSTIRIRMNLTLKEGITDSDTSLGQIDLTSFGCVKFQYNVFNHTALFDTGNAIVSLYIGGDGSIITKDVIVRGSSSAYAPAIQGYVDFQIPVRDVNKLDDYCDKFYWKRIS